MTYRNTDDALAAIRSLAQERIREFPTDGLGAVLLGLVANAERRHFEEVTALRLALGALVDHETDPCQLDHHGNCQAHGVSKPCHVAVAKALLKGPLNTDWMRLWDAASEAFLAYRATEDERNVVDRAAGYPHFHEAMSALGQALAEHKAKWAPA